MITDVSVWADDRAVVFYHHDGRSSYYKDVSRSSLKRLARVCSQEAIFDDTRVQLSYNGWNIHRDLDGKGE